MIPTAYGFLPGHVNLMHGAARENESAAMGVGTGTAYPNTSTDLHFDSPRHPAWVYPLCIALPLCFGRAATFAKPLHHDVSILCLLSVVRMRGMPQLPLARCSRTCDMLSLCL